MIDVSPILLLHAGNALLLVSLAANDVLWLRLLHLLSGGLFLGANLATTSPDAALMAWNVLFGGINLWYMRRIIRERRPPRLHREEQALYALAFSALTPAGFRRLLDLGEWEQAAPSQVLLSSGVAQTRLWVIASGGVDLCNPEESPVRLAPGDFIGDSGYFTGDPLRAEVVVATDVRAMTWKLADIRRFVDTAGADGAVLQRILGQRLARRFVGGGRVELALPQLG